MCFKPKRASGGGRIDGGLLPPCSFITSSMNLAVMAPAQRNGELIADLAPECAVLCKTKMMGIRRAPAAYQTLLFSYKLDVFLVTEAPRLGIGQLALIDAIGNGCPGGPPFGLGDDWR
jgi:hypothetical protein